MELPQSFWMMAKPCYLKLSVNAVFCLGFGYLFVKNVKNIFVRFSKSVQVKKFLKELAMRRPPTCLSKQTATTTHSKSKFLNEDAK